MFQANWHKSSNNHQYTSLRKRALFHLQIRRQQKQKIFQKIRQQLMMPQQLNNSLHKNISENLSKIMEYIQDQQYEQWHFLISQKIKANHYQLDKILYDDCWQNNHRRIVLFVFLMKNDQNIVEFYKNNIKKIVEKGLNWIQEEQMSLFIIFTSMLKSKYSFVIKDAIEYCKMVKFSSFWPFQLKFYYTLLKQYGSLQDFTQYGDIIFPINTMRKLSHHLQSTYYNLDQIQKMIQILIMLLYVSPKENISSNFNLQSLFTNLQFYIGYFKENTKLTQISIYLIYNINIDASSQKFITHDGFNTIASQMKRDCHHPQMRCLMVELYINTILNYPRNKFRKYLTKSYKKICEEVQYILDNFNYKQSIMDISSQLICFIVQFMQCQGDRELQKQCLDYMGKSLVQTLKKDKQFQGIVDIILKK